MAGEWRSGRDSYDIEVTSGVVTVRHTVRKIPHSGSYENNVLRFSIPGYVWHGSTRYSVTTDYVLTFYPPELLEGASYWRHPHLPGGGGMEEIPAGTDTSPVTWERVSGLAEAYERLAIDDPIVGTWNGQGSHGDGIRSFSDVKITLERGNYRIDGVIAAFDHESKTLKCEVQGSGFTESHEWRLEAPDRLTGTTVLRLSNGGGHTSDVVLQKSP